jgi:HK97 gp10 family phage protein
MSRSSLAAQSRALGKRLEAIPAEVLAELRPALLQAGNDVADRMRALAEGSRDTGALIDTITVTGPGDTTPPYASGGGSIVAKPNQVLVTTGSPDMRHGHLVEFGTVKTEAQPFMRPGFRLARPKVMARISRAISKAIKRMGGR